MGTRIDPGKARAWLDSIPGKALGSELRDQWQRFAASARPVVTVYGAYDTGKSSLLRRLIVDAGAQVPQWLTISARHETFEVNGIEAAGCVLRDTPGFVTGGDDVRSDMNTQLADNAVGLTDVAIVAVTPQLATAEYRALQKLVAQDWVQGALWFVISRFDEAGVDPESDPDGYRALADRKTAELRRAFELSENVPVFVVSQDFAQMAGSERNPISTVWDEFRKWDGVDRLSRALADLASSDLDTLRSSAAQRFWRSHVAESLAGLRSQLDKCAAQRHLAKEGLQRRMSWLAQLDVVKRSAEADLKGRISENIGAVVDDQRCSDAIQLSLNAAVDLWYATQERNLDKLRRDVDATTTIERRRPSWHQLEGLIHTVKNHSDPKATAADNGEIFTSAVSRVSKAALTALTEYEKIDVPKRPGAVAGRAAAAVCHRVAVASAVVPVIGELASIGEGLHRDKVNEDERRRRREAAVTDFNRLAERVTLIALGEFDPVIEATRQLIIDATADQANVWDGLDQLVRGFDVLIESGRAMLS